MIGLDTNVLVRFFTSDDLQQQSQAAAILRSLSSTEPGWVPVATLMELEWVLRRVYRLNRVEMIRILDSLLARREILFEMSEIIQAALAVYRAGNTDFPDCLIACSSRAAGCTKTVTFDRRAARDAGMELIP